MYDSNMLLKTVTCKLYVWQSYIIYKSYYVIYHDSHVTYDCDVNFELVINLL